MRYMKKSLLLLPVLGLAACLFTGCKDARTVTHERIQVLLKQEADLQADLKVYEGTSKERALKEKLQPIEEELDRLAVEQAKQNFDARNKKN